jgi:DnaK suppressor protein
MHPEVAAVTGVGYNTRPLRLKESTRPVIVAAKSKSAKKPAAKPAKKPARPAPKAKAPVKPKAAAKPAARPKAASKPAPKKPVKPATKAKAKPAVKAKPAPKSASRSTGGGVVKRLASAVSKLMTPTAKPGAAKAPAKAAPAKTAPAKAAAPKPAPAKAAPAKPAPKAAPVKTTASVSGSTSTAGIAMTSTSTARAAAPAPTAAASRDSGIKAKAVKPSRPTQATEPPLNPLPDRVDLPPDYKPAAGEEYMSPFQLEYFRQKLLTWRAELVEESKQTIDNLREEVRDVGDDAERATRETENSLELRTRDRYRKLISKIDKALKRIEDGAYGYCEETGEEIGIERLEARPIATLCLDAQERWEHRQRLMGD